MDYYILLPGDSKDDLINDSNHLGVASFKTFWPGDGLSALMEISNKKPELLEHIKIFTDTGKELSLQAFMSEIDKLSIRIRE